MGGAAPRRGYLRPTVNTILRHLLLPAVLLPGLVAAQPATKEDSLRLMNESIKAMFDTKDITVEPSYSFQHLVRYQSHKTSWKGPKDEVVEVHFSDGSGLIGVGSHVEEHGQSANMFLVFDHPHLTSLTFMDSDEDVCMRMRVPDPWSSSPRPVVVFKRTGAKRTIAGMEAHQWTSETDKDMVEVWVAPMQNDLRPLWRAWAKLNGQPAVGGGDYENGLVLAASLKKKDGSEPYAHFEALEVKMNAPLVFETKGYAVQ